MWTFESPFGGGSLGVVEFTDIADVLSSVVVALVVTTGVVDAVVVPTVLVASGVVIVAAADEVLKAMFAISAADVAVLITDVDVASGEERTEGVAFTWAEASRISKAPAIATVKRTREAIPAMVFVFIIVVIYRLISLPLFYSTE